MQIKKWQLLNRTVVYENDWISVEDCFVESPTAIRTQYGKVHYKNATVGIIPILDDGSTILVGQQRFPTGTYSWEIPMGGVNDDESPKAAAVRELREETGCVAEQWNHLLYAETSNSVTDEVVSVFVCKDVSLEKRDLDPTESIEVKIIPFEKAVDMVMNGKIVDAISIASILKYNTLKDYK